MKAFAIVQGGRRQQVEVAGRVGTSQLLVIYRIASGARRERWIAADRVEITGGDLQSLPRYQRRTCPAVKFDAPVLIRWHRHDWGAHVDHPQVVELSSCSRCGRQHGLVAPVDTLSRRVTHYTGRRALSLGIVRVDEEVTS